MNNDTRQIAKSSLSPFLSYVFINNVLNSLHRFSMTMCFCHITAPWWGQHRNRWETALFSLANELNGQQGIQHACRSVMGHHV